MRKAHNSNKTDIMKTIISISLLVIISFKLNAQSQIDKKAEAIVKEGKKLYRSEMASWYGTDILLEKLNDRKKEIGGYFSYVDGDSARFIFLTKGEDPAVMASVAFDSTYKPEHAAVYMSQRKLSNYEKELAAIRLKMFKLVNTDTFFLNYKNCDLNIIPISEGNIKKAYVLTGPKENNVMVFGNDYEVIFDKNYEVKSKRRIHKNIQIQDFSKLKTVIVGIHNHLPSTGELITPTDVCTLMLYERIIKLEQYIVISQKYVSLWTCKNNTLNILTREAWEKIYNNKESHHLEEGEKE